MTLDNTNKFSTSPPLSWIDIQTKARQLRPRPKNAISKSNLEWQEILSEQAYIVTRLHGTERAFSSEMCNRFEPGLYACICCNTPLFDAQTKFDSGSGWPSFHQAINDHDVDYIEDLSHGMTRIEVRCHCCEAHLGHVFPDGPKPTGLRYCINAVALKAL